MIAGMAGAYQNEAPRAPFWDRLLALQASIRLGWDGLPGTNNLAYYENP